MDRFWIASSLLVQLLRLTSAEIAFGRACPNEDLILSCSSDSHRLVIRRASYGVPTKPGTCQPPALIAEDRNCNHPDALGALARSCFGRSRCLIGPDNRSEVFNSGDPCKGTPRYIDVEYECIEGQALTNICAGNDVPIEFPLRGYVTSINYPDNYYNGQACRRSVKGQLGQTITITMLDLNMQYSMETRHCYDFVLFTQYTSNRPPVIYCDKQLAANDKDLVYQLTETAHVNVSFESSTSTAFRGFLFEYKVTGCATADVPAPPHNGLVTSFGESQFVLYGCYHGYELVSSTGGALSCSITNNRWLGDRGVCRKLQIPPSTPRAPTTTPMPTTKSTSRPTATKTRTTPSTPVITTRSSSTTRTTATTSTPSREPWKTTGIDTPVWALEPDPATSSSTTVSATTTLSSTTAKESLVVSSSGLSGTTVAIIAGGVGAALILAIVIAVVLVYRRRRKTNRMEKINGLSSLRPSAHACVSIPNTYAGVGYIAAKAASLSSSASERNSAYARTSQPSSAKSQRQSDDSDISYESSMYSRGSESLKGSADPILTQSVSSFDCLDMTRGRVTSAWNKGADAERAQTVAATVKTEERDGGPSSQQETTSEAVYLNPIAAFPSVDEYPGPAPSSPPAPPAPPAPLPWSPDAPLPPTPEEEAPVDSSILYVMARPSLETIREEHEVDLLPTQPPSMPVTPSGSRSAPCSAYAVSEFDFGRQGADSQSGEPEIPDDLSERTNSSDIKPKVGKRRVRTRPVSMGEADQPESKRRMEKVEYALFKEDDTGNLDNFLDHRRVSV